MVVDAGPDAGGPRANMTIPEHVFSGRDESQVLWVHPKAKNASDGFLGRFLSATALVWVFGLLNRELSGSALPAEHSRSLPIHPLGDMLNPT